MYVQRCLGLQAARDGADSGSNRPYAARKLTRSSNGDERATGKDGRLATGGSQEVTEFNDGGSEEVDSPIYIFRKVRDGTTG